MKAIRFSLIPIFVILSLTVLGQSDRGTITGTVMDSTGAVVPGVTITATNADTGVKTTVVSSESGLYTIPVRPGTYTIEAELTGFKKLRREGITVNLLQTVRLDLTLEVGEVSETVNVVGEAPLLRKDTSELATQLPPKQFIDLPLAVNGNIRSVESFILLTPGVTGDTFYARINGSQGFTKEIQLDGVTMSISELQGDPRVLRLPPEAIQEFRMTTNNFSAEFGRTGGGIESFTIRSGTNEFHGSAFEYLRNDALDARGFFQDRVPVNKQNEFGFTIGGPVVFPKLYNGRNKTFWFAAYDAYRTRQGAQNLLASVPTQEFRNGDLSALRDPEGNLIQIYDPLTTRPDGRGGFTRDPFPGNIIPQTRISPVAKALIPLIPLPNRPGIANNFLSANRGFVRQDNFTIKVDHAASDKQQWSVSWNWAAIPDSGPAFALPYPLANSRNGLNNQRTLRVNNDYSIRPNVINHFAFGFNRNAQHLVSPEQGKNWPERLGIKGVPNGAFPAFIFAGSGIDVLAGTFTSLGLNQEELKPISNTYIVLDNVSWVRGRHSMKAGFEYRWYQNNFLFPSTSGSFTFLRNQTAHPAAIAGTGNPWASFLLGYVHSASFRLAGPEVAGRWRYLGTFFQDDFKVTPKFTLNLGIRYEIPFPLFDNNDAYSSFLPDIPNPGAGNRPGALAFAGKGPGRIGRRRFVDTDFKEFGPRFGFAYSFTERVVVRGGYGIFYSTGGANAGSNFRGYLLGFDANPTKVSLDGISPAFLIHDGFPQDFPRPPFIDPTFANNQGIFYSSPDGAKAPYISNWNLDVQFELPHQLLLDFAYVGTKSTRLPSGMSNRNQVDPKFLALGELLRVDINSDAARAAGIQPPYPGFRGSVAQALRPYPQYLGIGDFSMNGNATYHAFQFKAEKRYSQGLFFLVAYTLSKSITDSNSILGGFFSISARDHYSRRAEKTLSTQDMPHNLVISFTYELPFGPGKRFLNRSGAAGKILGGWQVTGITRYTSGTPLGIGFPNTLPLFNASNRVDRVLGVSPKLHKGGKFDPATDVYANRAAFKEPAPFTFGNAPALLPDLRGFPSYNEDLGIMKLIGITENTKLEFRTEFFNAFNRHIFSAPNLNFGDPFSFGKVFAASGGRQIQFALKLHW